MAAGTSLVESLHGLSTAGVQPVVSHTAAMVVASANKIRQAARVSAAAAASTAAGPRRIMRLGRRKKGPAVPAVPADMGQREGESAFEAGAPFPESSEMKQNQKAREALESELGWAVPAVALRRSSSTGLLQREPVLLYFGIIDFLQPYNARKKLERAWKASLHGQSVSVADPGFYAKRFLASLKNVFVEEGSHGGDFMRAVKDNPRQAK